MNKLYVVNYRMPNGYLMHSAASWSYKEAKQLMAETPHWDYELVESSPAHIIWEGR